VFLDNLLQPTHLLVILAVALIVLGPKRLPEVGHALGKGLRDFKDAISGERDEDHAELLGPQMTDTEHASSTMAQPVSAPQPTSSTPEQPSPPAPPSAAQAPADKPAGQ
jgi:sec-independent protein translocase protein TatA